MKQEIERTRSAVECIGASAVRILLGPYFAHETGEALNESDAADDDHAATKLELAGACWVLPDFYGELEDVELISTFKKHLVRQLADASSTEYDAEATFRELWGPGGPLRLLALKSESESSGPRGVLATDPKGLLEHGHMEIVKTLTIAFLGSTDDEKRAQLAAPSTPSEQPPSDGARER